MPFVFGTTPWLDFWINKEANVRENEAKKVASNGTDDEDDPLSPPPSFRNGHQVRMR